jgi:hypothetical protein
MSSLTQHHGIAQGAGLLPSSSKALGKRQQVVRLVSVRVRAATSIRGLVLVDRLIRPMLPSVRPN